jgi:hypothetical protein
VICAFSSPQRNKPVEKRSLDPLEPLRNYVYTSVYVDRHIQRERERRERIKERVKACSIYKYINA